MRVALDAMGGDFAPREAVLGALRALDEVNDLHIFLVGREDAIRAELKDQTYDAKRLTIVHAAEVIECHESPADALRKKRDNSISVACGLVARGMADGCLSAGNTGAMVGAATFILKLIPGVLKAGIAVALGNLSKPTVLVDVGANVYCKPMHLLHYGVMASAFTRQVLGVAEPRVALLSIGAEDAKGNDLVKETRELFEKAPLKFIGHVEGNDLFNEVADVVVCEGFVGNVILKLAEGLSEKLHRNFETIIGSAPELAANSMLQEKIQRFRKATDYAEVGAAPLLGVNGTCMIAHGRSDRRAIGNAVKMTDRFARAGVVATIAEGVKTERSDSC